MEIQWKKHVRIVCDLEVGDKVTVDGWGRELDGKTFVITDIEFRAGRCESGFMIGISGRTGKVDSNWLNKVPKENG